MLKLKSEMTPDERLNLGDKITKNFLDYQDSTQRELTVRINGVSAKAGASGKQFVGYTILEQFYRGDQWDHDEQPGASQRTDNYCSVIIDNLSSLPFDDTPEINCPTDDPTDDLLALKAEMKERMIMRVWEDNDYETEFDDWSKIASLYGDGFIKGPYLDKDERGRTKISFCHIEDSASISPIFHDSSRKRLYGFIHHNRILLRDAERIYGEQAALKGIKILPSLNKNIKTLRSTDDMFEKFVNIDEFWTDEYQSVFINDKLLDFYSHNWGFVPLVYVKANHSPNYPYGKSDLEDIIDPQLSHNRTNNDLANMLKWVTSVNMWGKNIEGMQALVSGLSKIYSLPDDGEIHTFEKPGDPYIANTVVQQRRSAMVELSGVSESMLSSSQTANASGRALALAFQGTLRKLNPRIKRFKVALSTLNSNILRLYEIAYPQTKVIIDEDYRNKVFIPATLFRNIVDTINKLQSGIISLDTAQREAGVMQPKMEQKLMKKTLADPVLGPQIARQPSLLPRLSEGQNQPGDNPMPGPGNTAVASQGGAVAESAQQAGGAAAVPTQ